MDFWQIVGPFAVIGAYVVADFLWKRAAKFLK